MSDVNTIKKQAKAAGINGRDLLNAKREIEQFHKQYQDFVNHVRRETHAAFVGEDHNFWRIFGHYNDQKSKHVFHSGGDYTTIKNWDTLSRTIFWSCPGLCSCEEDASEALWNFIKDEPFTIPSNTDMYKEAFNRLVDSLELVV